MDCQEKKSVSSSARKKISSKGSEQLPTTPVGSLGLAAEQHRLLQPNTPGEGAFAFESSFSSRTSELLSSSFSVPPKSIGKVDNKKAMGEKELAEWVKVRKIIQEAEAQENLSVAVGGDLEEEWPEEEDTSDDDTDWGIGGDQLDSILRDSAKPEEKQKQDSLLDDSSMTLNLKALSTASTGVSGKPELAQSHVSPSKGRDLARRIDFGGIISSANQYNLQLSKRPQQQEALKSDKIHDGEAIRKPH